MIGSLITSKTRIKLLKKFFLNSNIKAHLRGLEAEFGESTNAIRIELNRLEKAGLLTSCYIGKKKMYQANSYHPLFSEIHSIILKETGINRLIEKIIERLGNLLYVYLIGDFAKGRDGHEIELILVGNNIDLEYLRQKLNKAEKIVGRRVSYKVFGSVEYKEVIELLTPEESLILWCNDSGALK